MAGLPLLEPSIRAMPVAALSTMLSAMTTLSERETRMAPEPERRKLQFES
jgi:hypothetical protein